MRAAKRDARFEGMVRKRRAQHTRDTNCGVRVEHTAGRRCRVHTTHRANRLVIVDRNTVPVGLGDVRVEFASTVEVQASVRFLHPTHNFALVQYRTEQLDPTEPDGHGGEAGEEDGEADVPRTCGVRTAAISSAPLEVGEECMFVGLPRSSTAR